MNIKKILLVIGVGASLLTAGCSSDKAKTEEAPEKEVAQAAQVTEVVEVKEETKVDEKIVSNLGITPQEFQYRYNTIVKEKDGNLGGAIVINVKTNDNGEEYFEIYHKSQTTMRVDIDKLTGNVEKASLFSSGFENDSEIAKYLYVADVMIGVTNPNLTHQEREKILFEEINIGETAKQYTTSEATSNGVKYKVSSTNDSSLLFSIDKVESELY